MFEGWVISSKQITETVPIISRWNFINYFGNNACLLVGQVLVWIPPKRK